jgi:hypothetical protein
MESRSPDHFQSGIDNTGLLRQAVGLNFFTEVLSENQDRGQVFIRVNVKYQGSHLPKHQPHLGFLHDWACPGDRRMTVRNPYGGCWPPRDQDTQGLMYSPFYPGGPFGRQMSGGFPNHWGHPVGNSPYFAQFGKSHNHFILPKQPPSVPPHFQRPVEQLMDLKIQIGVSEIKSVIEKELNHKPNDPIIYVNGFSQPLVSSELPNLGKLKEVISRYFFEPDLLPNDYEFSNLETQIIKVMLIKKLVHDKKKSKIFYAIRNLREVDVIRFLQMNPAINRKNIIKSNIFKRAWKLLEKRHKVGFFDHYFNEFMHNTPADYFSIKEYRRGHCFNLADEFYCRCLASNRFRTEFFEVLQDEFFKDSVLKQSRHKFLNSFDYWMNETVVFLQKCPSPFERNTKMPEFKYGMSAKDFELAPSLFLRLTGKD